MPPKKGRGSRKTPGRTSSSRKKPVASIDEKADSQQLDNYDDSFDSFGTESYSCTGNFEEDFIQLCQLRDLIVIPPVTALPQPSKTPPEVVPSEKVLVSRRKSARKIGIFKQAPPKVRLDTRPSTLLEANESQETVRSEKSETELDSGFKPTTFTLKDKFDFFKPRVQVEYSKLNESVSEIRVRGWKVDSTMMGIFRYCCPSLEYLSVLHLWNVGLTSETLDILLLFLPQCNALTTLVLDANPLGDGANVGSLIDEKSNLEDLSLRFCELNDMNAIKIGSALGSTKTWNKKLISLNISNNKIGDRGAVCIANGLKTNRTLLTLNLASNQIGNEGAAALAEALSQFVLDTEQMLMRRQIQSERETTPIMTFPPRMRASVLPVKHAAALTQQKSRRKGVRLEKDHDKELDSKKRKGKEREGDGSRVLPGTASASQDLSNGDMSRKKGSPSPSSRRDKEVEKNQSTEKRHQSLKTGLDTPLSKEVGEGSTMPTWHPLLEVGIQHEEKFWILGNRTLISLNLARNQIGISGLDHLWEMLKVQALPCHDQQQKGSGLMRLVVHKNGVPMDHAVIKLISHRMLIKDPLHRVPFIRLHRNNIVPCAMPPIMI